MKLPGLLFVISILISISSQGQQTKVDSFFTHTPLFLKSSFQHGSVFPTNEFVSGQNQLNDQIETFNSISMVLLKQTKGDKLWEQLYGYPVYGIGFYSAIFHETKELGTPIATFGYLSAPFFRLNKFSINYELGLGIAFNWKSFDVIENPYNIAISSDITTFVEAGVNISYCLNKKNIVEVGYGFNHYSNGKLKMPNLGLNTGAVKFSYRYQLNNKNYSFLKIRQPKFEKHFEYDLSFYGGVRNITYPDNNVDSETKFNGVFFPVLGVINTLSRKLDNKSKIGFGFSFGYNGSLNSKITIDEGELEGVELPAENHVTISIFPSYELVVDRLSFIIQPGFYIYRKKPANISPVNYQRIGIKYHFLNDYFLGVSLRAYEYHLSDFIEWNIGKRIKW